MPSPFLDANPSFTRLSTSAVPSKIPLADGEYTKFALYDFRHRKIFESKLRPVVKGVPNLEGLPRVGFSKGSKWVWLSFLLVRNSKQYWSRRRYQVVFPKGGQPYFPGGNGTAMNNQRRESMGKVTPPQGKRTNGGPHLSTPRPNPETRNKIRQNFTEGNNGGYFFSPSTSVEETFSRTWSGVNTPGFGGLKKSHRPINNHHVTLVETSDMGLLDQTEIPSTGVYFNQFSAMTRCYNAPVLPSHDATATSKAIKKLIQRMENGIEGNLAQDVVQIRQTVKLITNTATRFTKTILALKNGNIPGAARALWGSSPPRYRRGGGPNHYNTFADNWLEMQYGWKPLLQDIHGAMESIAKMNLADASIKQVTASAQTTKWDVSDLPLFANNQKVGGWKRIQTQSRCKFGVRFTVDNHLLAFVQQLGFTNPLNLLWEVIPFSFVVDWFMPIGPWLETLTAYQGLVFLDGFQTNFTKQTTESLVRFEGEALTGQMLQSNGNYFRQAVILDRVKLGAFPTSSFPTFKSPLSMTHASNAFALMLTAFKP